MRGHISEVRCQCPGVRVEEGVPSGGGDQVVAADALDGFAGVATMNTVRRRPCDSLANAAAPGYVCARIGPTRLIQGCSISSALAGIDIRFVTPTCGSGLCAHHASRCSCFERDANEVMHVEEIPWRLALFG